MNRVLAICAGVAVSAMIAGAAPAGAAEGKTQSKTLGVAQAGEVEISSARRHRGWRHRHHWNGRRYYGRPYYRNYGYYRPHGYYRPYYRPYYYRPGPFISFGPFGFGF
jgi:hypothetical protein